MTMHRPDPVLVRILVAPATSILTKTHDVAEARG
jgi:hypothetical protein